MAVGLTGPGSDSVSWLWVCVPISKDMCPYRILLETEGSPDKMPSIRVHAGARNGRLDGSSRFSIMECGQSLWSGLRLLSKRLSVVLPLIYQMASDLIPLTEILVKGDAKAKGFDVPQRYMVLPGHVNIQRVGTKAVTNTFVCREEGCTWRKEAIPERTAREHVKTHGGDKPCHLFEAVRRTEVLEQYAAKCRAKNKRRRDRLKAEQASAVPRHKRFRPGVSFSFLLDTPQK